MDSYTAAKTYNHRPGAKSAFPEGANLGIVQPQHSPPEKAVTDNGSDVLDSLLDRVEFNFAPFECHNIHQTHNYMLTRASLVEYSCHQQCTDPLDIRVRTLNIRLCAATPGTIDLPSTEQFEQWDWAVNTWDFSTLMDKITINQFLVLASSNSITQDCVPSTLSHATMLQTSMPHNCVALGGRMVSLPAHHFKHDILTCPMAPRHFYAYVSLWTRCLLLCGIKVAFTMEDIRAQCYAMWLSYGRLMKISECGTTVEIPDINFLNHLAPYITVKTLGSREVKSYMGIINSVGFKLFDKFSLLSKEAYRQGPPDMVHLPKPVWDTFKGDPPVILAITAGEMNGPVDLEMPHDTILEDYKLTALLIHNVGVSKGEKGTADLDRALKSYTVGRKTVDEIESWDKRKETGVVISMMHGFEASKRFEAWRKFNAVCSTWDPTFNNFLAPFNLGNQGTHKKLFGALYACGMLDGRGKTAIDLCSGEGGFTRLLSALNYIVSFMDSDNKLSDAPINTGTIKFPLNRLPTDLKKTIGLVEQYKDYGADLVVSDGFNPDAKLKPSDNEYSATELWRATANFFTIQLVFGDALVGAGGTLIVKLLGMPERDQYMELIEQISSKYANIQLVKSSVSCPASFEFYIVLGNKMAEAVPHESGWIYAQIISMICIFAAQRRRILTVMLARFTLKLQARNGLIGYPKPRPYNYTTAKHDWPAIGKFVNTLIDGLVGQVDGAIEELSEATSMDCGDKTSAPPPSPSNWIERVNMGNSKGFLSHVCQFLRLGPPHYSGWLGIDPAKKACVSVIDFNNKTRVVQSKHAYARKMPAQADAAYYMVRELNDEGFISEEVFRRFF